MESLPKNTFDAIAREMAQLRETIAGHKAAGDMGTLDSKALAAVVMGLVDQQVKARTEEAERRKPVRRGEIVGPVGMPGFAAPFGGLVERGKFAGVPVDDVLFTDWFLKTVHAKHPDRVKLPSKELSDLVAKALSATGAAAGDEYVPTGMAAQLWQDMFLASKIVAAIGPMAQPTDPWDFPLGWGTVTWRKGSQNTAATVSDPATAKSTFTSTEQVAEVNWAYDLDEDSVVAVLPTLRTELQRDGAEQMDRFLINADFTDAGTGNINLDDANPPDDSYYLSNGQDGIRHLYLVDNTAQSTDINATLTDALLRAGIGRLGRYAADVGRLVMFTDPETYVNGILGLTNVATVDKFGPQATILTGQLAAYAGIPLIPTAALLEAEDDGKQSTTAANNDEGQIAIVHRDMWKVAFKRQLMIEIDRNIQKRQFIMVVSFRVSVAARGTRSTATHTSGVHGIVRA
jgi:hypothetical protein